MSRATVFHFTEPQTHDPYNPLNVEITKETVEQLLQLYGISAPIHNLELYKRAFVHESYVTPSQSECSSKGIKLATECPVGCIPLKSKSNQRLEYLGDGVLECVTKYYLYKRFPRADEKFLTNKKIALVNNVSIGNLACTLGLNKYYLLSKQLEQDVRNNHKALGCLFEAFVGALFLDFNHVEATDEVEEDDKWLDGLFSRGSGFKMCMKFIEAVFEEHVNWSQLIQTDDNYKNILQTIIQKEFKIVPEYLPMKSFHTTDGYNMGVFLCMGQPISSVKVSDAISLNQFRSFQQIHEYMAVERKLFIKLGEGHNKHKTSAEQHAAHHAIKYLNTIL